MKTLEFDFVVVGGGAAGEQRRLGHGAELDARVLIDNLLRLFCSTGRRRRDPLYELRSIPERRVAVVPLQMGSGLHRYL